VTGPRAGAWPVAGLPAGADGAAVVEVEEVAEGLGLAGAGFFAVRPERRKARAGDDGEFGGGSGISQAKAAGGTLDASGAGADKPKSDERGAGDVVADDPGPDVVPAADVGAGASPAGLAGAEGVGLKLNTDESPVPDCFPAAGSDLVDPVDPLGLPPRAGPTVSAGSAGMPSTTVASAGAGRAASFAAGAAPASAAGASCFPAAGVPFAETPPPALPSDTASPTGAGLRAGFLGGAMMSLVPMSSVMSGAPVISTDVVSWSSIRSSPVVREVTMVGEPPPRPPGLSVRLSKPSSL